MPDDRINPAALSRPKTDFQRFEFKDPNQPDTPLVMNLRPLTPGAYLKALSFAQELNRLYVIGGGYFRGEIKAEAIPFPPLSDGSQPELCYELIEQCCVLEFGQGVRRNALEPVPPPFYTAEMLIAANETMPIAMNQAIFVAENFVANPKSFAPVPPEKKEGDQEPNPSGTTSSPPESPQEPATSEQSTTTPDVSTISAEPPTPGPKLDPLT